MLGHCKGFTSLHSNPAQQRSSVSTCSLADNVARLPSTASVRRIQVLSSFPSSIENVPGKHASVAIYTFLARKYSGRIDQAAAQEGVLLYDEAVADAIARPGAHANIDILLSIVDGTLPFVEVEVVE